MFIKNISRFCLIAFIFIASAATLFAQPSLQPSDKTQQNLKTITLKDGTKIKGKLVGVQDNTYSIETTHFGRINVADSDVESIANTAIQPISTPEAGASPSNSSQPLKEQAAALQQQIMADPEAMSSIQEVASDPKFVEILKDPDLMNALMSHDPQKIQTNPKIQTLLHDPKMQKLMQHMSQKHLGQ